MSDNETARALVEALRYATAVNRALPIDEKSRRRSSQSAQQEARRLYAAQTHEARQAMTPIRSRNGHIIHTTDDLRHTTCCGRKCDGWIVEPDAAVTCRGKRSKEQQ